MADFSSFFTTNNSMRPVQAASPSEETPYSLDKYHTTTGTLAMIHGMPAVRDVSRFRIIRM